MNLTGKHVLVTGGTGSLGKTVVSRLLGQGTEGPSRVTVFSRDEAKQHYMRLAYLDRSTATDEVIYQKSRDALRFLIGDVRRYSDVVRAVSDADIVIHAAALKQVPSCEYFPEQAIETNIQGPLNLVRAIRETKAPVESLIGISTDKACKPVNVMGMTKAVMERVLVEANLQVPKTRFACVRYGNVIASRGSVIPLFLDQIASGGPVTITLKEMTRFFLSLERAVDTVLDALAGSMPGEIYVPRVPAMLIEDLVQVLIEGRGEIPIEYTGIRPGEKIHEVMVSDEERYRTVERGAYFVIRPMLPEIETSTDDPPMQRESYTSADEPMDKDGIRKMLSEGFPSFVEDSVQ